MGRQIVYFCVSWVANPQALRTTVHYPRPYFTCKKVVEQMKIAKSPEDDPV